MESRSRQRNHAADEGHWGELRLVEGEVYTFTGNVAGGARSFVDFTKKIDLPRKPAGELCPFV